MCNFFSCIADREGNVYTGYSDNHSRIISMNSDKLKDSGDIVDFVRIEVGGLTEQILLSPFENKDAVMKLDETNIPEWYERMLPVIKENVFHAIITWQNSVMEELHKAIRDRDIEGLFDFIFSGNTRISDVLIEHCDGIKNAIIEEYDSNREPDEPDCSGCEKVDESECRCDAIAECVKALENL